MTSSHFISFINFHDSRVIFLNCIFADIDQQSCDWQTNHDNRSPCHLIVLLNKLKERRNTRCYDQAASFRNFGYAVKINNVYLYFAAKDINIHDIIPPFLWESSICTAIPVQMYVKPKTTSLPAFTFHMPSDPSQYGLARTTFCNKDSFKLFWFVSLVLLMHKFPLVSFWQIHTYSKPKGWSQ